MSSAEGGRRARRKARRPRCAAPYALALLVVSAGSSVSLGGARMPPGFGSWDPSVESRWDRRPASLGIENGYRDTLAAWAGGVEGAAVRYAAFQVQVVERIIGTQVSPTNLRYEETERALRCLDEIERNTQRLLRLEDAEVLPVVSAFQLEVYLDHLARPGGAWIARLNWERFDELWRSFRGRDSAPPKGSDEMLALLFLETGARLEELGLIGQLARARESFERAIEHSPGSVAARYRAAFLAEKLGLYRRAHRQLDWLVERLPDDPEIRLRRAVVASRLGPGEAWVDALEDLGHTGGERWIRVVAFQELARAVAAEDPVVAIEVLRDALKELPGDQGLEIQLANRLGAGSEEGQRLLRTVIEREAAREAMSPRGRYEEGRKTELRAAQVRFAIELAPRRARLTEALDRVERFETVRDARRRHFGVDSDPSRKVFFDCHGYKSPVGDNHG